MPYFSSSTPPYILKHLVERAAQDFRRYLDLLPDEVIDPFEIADWLGIEVKYPYQLAGLEEDFHTSWRRDEGTGWSGMTFYLANGEIWTVLNATHSARRQRATLMEEVGHVHLAHGPSILTVDPTSGFLKRSYEKRVEQEAYWFGAATLVPKCGLRSIYMDGGSMADASEHYMVSDELITFRTNLCGLRKLAS